MLKGNRQGQWSIRINDQWRLCFIWTGQDAEDVEITDYHQEVIVRTVPYPTPGEILLEEFLKPMGVTQYRLAKAIGVPQRRIGEIVAGKRAITMDTGLRLSRYFGTSETFWTGLQLSHDQARVKDALADVLAAIQPMEHA